MYVYNWKLLSINYVDMPVLFCIVSSDNLDFCPVVLMINVLIDSRSRPVMRHPRWPGMSSGCTNSSPNPCLMHPASNHSLIYSPSQLINCSVSAIWLLGTWCLIIWWTLTLSGLLSSFEADTWKIAVLCCI